MTVNERFGWKTGEATVVLGSYTMKQKKTIQSVEGSVVHNPAEKTTCEK